jgi:GNAT superfamily N-acetyltransferase
MNLPIIELIAYPDICPTTAFMQDFLATIWPHRVEVISYELDTYRHTGEGDVFFWIMVDNQIAGITGHYDYDEQSAGLGWHGLLPQYRRDNISATVIKMVIDEAKKTYPIREYFIEIIPDNNPKLIKHFTHLGFHVYERAVESFHWLPEAEQGWVAYAYPLKSDTVC